jgi:hypothetical protein
MRTRQLLAVALVLCAVAPLAAQAPAGWKMRVDRSTSASDPDASGDIKFMAMGSSFHAVNPQAAVYWNPSNTATGTYTVKGTFKLLKPSDHENYYGLIFAGSNLEGADQAYLYFVVSQNGRWLVKRRAGSETPIVADKTSNAAVNKPGADGTSVNALEVRVMADKVDFVVNGTVVHSEPKTGALATTNGIYGLRINHHLEVQIDGFGVAK